MIMIIMLMIVIRRRMGEGQDEVEEGDEGQRCSRGSRMGGAERADDGGNGEGERRKFLLEGRTVRGGGGGMWCSRRGIMMKRKVCGRDVSQIRASKGEITYRKDNNKKRGSRRENTEKK